MAKKVRYNGRKETFMYSTNPKELVVGKEYEVIHEEDLGFQTNYILRGVKGEFNSVWFDVVEEETEKKDEYTQPKVYLGVSKVLPEVGKGYSCSKLEFFDGKAKLVRCQTSEVKDFEDMGSNIYRVRTRNSVYIVKINTAR